MVFEPLRRNKAYQRAYDDYISNPVDDPFLELKRSIDFCNKWKTPCDFDPASDWASFRGPSKHETESEAKRRIQGTSLGVYVPLSDRAAFVPLDDVIVDRKYMRLAIDLRKSRYRIESDVKEELDYWQRDEWTKVRHGKRLRRIAEAEILTFSVRDSSLVLKINLEAPRRSIDRKIAEVLSRELPKWRKKSKGSEKRFHPEKWEAYFDVYDRIQKGKKSLHNVSKDLRRPIKTVRRQYQQAWEAINGKPYPNFKRLAKNLKMDQEFVEAETLVALCDACTNRKCEKTNQMCRELFDLQKTQPKYVLQDLPKKYIAMEKTRILRPSKPKNPPHLSTDD